MRKVIHLDLDCFYAAVEIKHRPELKGKPVAVGGPPDSRSVVCTANYEARAFGVKAAVPSSRAVRLCPQLILVPPRFDLYKKESRAVREIFLRYTPLVEPLSLDEAYLDVTEAGAEPGGATRIAREIREAVRSELGLSISAGVAPNKFLAKIASDWKKPDGLFVIPPAKVGSFVRELPVEKIFGVGKVTAARMHGLGLRTCADLQGWSVPELRRHFGSRAQDLFRLSRGEDDRPVENEWERKSLSVEETFSTDLSTWERIRAELPGLYSEWKARLDRSGEAGRIAGAVVKMKFADFKTTTHEESVTGLPPLALFEKLADRAWSRRPEPIRLLGIGARLGRHSPEEKDQLAFEEA